MSEDNGFFSRWSRRKVKAREGEPTEPALAPVPADVPAEMAEPALVSPDKQAEGVSTEGAPPAPALPTLTDVEALTHESDFARFVAPEVHGEVRNAALKKLFTDPHFNVMDGLDTYIGDYNTPDPLPASVLKKMAQSAYLGLVEPEVAKPLAPPMTAEAEVEAEPLATPDVPEEATEQETSGAVLEQEPEPPPPDESVAGNVPVTSMKAHDEDPDLRLQSHHASGPPGLEPGTG